MPPDEEIIPELAEYPPIMTAHQLADLLGLTYQGVREAMKAGRLPGRQMGTSWRVRRSEVQALILGTWQPRDPAETNQDDDNADDGE